MKCQTNSPIHGQDHKSSSSQKPFCAFMFILCEPSEKTNLSVLLIYQTLLTQTAPFSESPKGSLSIILSHCKICMDEISSDIVPDIFFKLIVSKRGSLSPTFYTFSSSLPCRRMEEMQEPPFCSILLWVVCVSHEAERCCLKSFLSSTWNILKTLRALKAPWQARWWWKNKKSFHFLNIDILCLDISSSPRYSTISECLEE